MFVGTPQGPPQLPCEDIAGQGHLGTISSYYTYLTLVASQQQRLSGFGWVWAGIGVWAGGAGDGGGGTGHTGDSIYWRSGSILPENPEFSRKAESRDF